MLYAGVVAFQVITLPVDLLGESWTEYVALVDLRGENENLRARVATLEEENLQFREALVASGNLERIVQMRGKRRPSRTSGDAQVVPTDKHGAAASGE